MADHDQLNQLTVLNPCAVEWEAMHGNDSVRFCETCQKNVYRFDDMTRQEIEELIDRSPNGLCAQMLKDADGTLVTKEYRPKVELPEPVAPTRRHFLRAALQTAGGLLAMFGLAGCGVKTTGERKSEEFAQRNDGEARKKAVESYYRVAGMPKIASPPTPTSQYPFRRSGGDVVVTGKPEPK